MQNAVEHGLKILRSVRFCPRLGDGGGLLETRHDGERKNALVVAEGLAVLFGHLVEHFGKKRTKGRAGRGGIPPFGKLERVGVAHEDRRDAEDDLRVVVGIARFIHHDAERVAGAVHQDVGENGGIADRRQRNDGAALILFGHRKFHPWGAERT